MTTEEIAAAFRTTPPGSDLAYAFGERAHLLQAAKSVLDKWARLDESGPLLHLRSELEALREVVLTVES